MKKCRGHQYRRSNQTHAQSSVPYRLFSEVVTLPDLWDTVGMINRPQALEDRKIQKLVERLDQKLALQAKGAHVQGQAPTAPVAQPRPRLDPDAVLPPTT